MFRIGEFSRLSRVSVRMLRHYDQLGLLKPSHTDSFTSYRYYSADQLPRLNRIIALRPRLFAGTDRRDARRGITLGAVAGDAQA